ncbi:alpha/beta-type small acid-soluble spore protein [Paenibacillus oceani]|uniref:Alpha/beta-type small acid-soluble spore protein n=1 Tax=Paenibacillus oceani TaxID=2772510 RepID=A0A927CEL2_9BACL|nr:alpha/beta-type small acid-soluble spore protein [Paenibacillus oceani]MBD2865223.1 alpha/beta-type small acid-soluble spore protein [Paenibacillus oceani]
MARRRSRRTPIVPEAGKSLDAFKVAVMKQEGYAVSPEQPDHVKFEVARTLGIPLTSGDNGQLTTEDAGKIGGQIGGAMVREMIKMAREQLKKQ